MSHTVLQKKSVVFEDAWLCRQDVLALSWAYHCFVPERQSTAHVLLAQNPPVFVQKMYDQP